LRAGAFLPLNLFPQTEVSSGPRPRKHCVWLEDIFSAAFSTGSEGSKNYGLVMNAALRGVFFAKVAQYS